MRLDLRARLFGGFGAVLLLLGAAGAWAVLQLRLQDAAYGAVLQTEAQGAALAQAMRAGLLLEVQAVKNTWIRGADPQQFARYDKEFAANALKLEELRA